MVAAAKELRAEDAGTGNGPENTDIKYRHKLVHNGNSGHLFRTDTPYHDVIQKTYKVRDTILNHDRYRHC